MPAFHATVEPLSNALRAEMTGKSWKPGCPVALDALALVRLAHWDLEGRLQTGELVVAARVAPQLVEVFRQLFAARFPIERMERVDRYDADDGRSMAANNSSAFNCRTVAGTGTWSEHALGTALDLNPVQNPWVRNGVVDPPAGAPYRDRSTLRPGMIVAGDAAVRAFASIGWGWGGHWRSPKDYQHFSESGL